MNHSVQFLICLPKWLCCDNQHAFLSDACATQCFFSGQVEWEGQWYDSYEKVPKTAKAAKKIRPSMFPPQQQPGSENVPLHRCMRFYPHINNTGIKHRRMHFRLGYQSAFVSFVRLFPPNLVYRAARLQRSYLFLSTTTFPRSRCIWKISAISTVSPLPCRRVFCSCLAESSGCPFCAGVERCGNRMHPGE